MSISSELSIAGRVLSAGDPDWDLARGAWNLVADQHPAAVALVQDAADVATVVDFARQHQLKVCAQGTGHGAGTLGDLGETIVIKTQRMRAIELDPDARRARVQAGVLACELGEAAQAAGLSSMPGSSPDVGVVGYTLGGGLGWLGRRHGFACNRVAAIELVTAGGEQMRVDGAHEPELFWALRGGGGGFAIVTALELDLLPIADLYAGSLLLPAELGLDALLAYRDWSETVADEVTSIVRFLRLPPLPDIPEPLRDRPLLTITAASIGTQAQGERAIAPLRELGEPIIDTFAQVPATQLCRINMDPEQPVPGIGDHALISALPDDALEAFLGVAGSESNSPLLLAELRHVGGALAHGPTGDGAGASADGSGALSGLDAAFVMNGVGTPMTPEMGQAIEAGLDRLVETMAPWSSTGGYLNFAEQPCELARIMPEPTCARLARVKRDWDPSGTLLANHPLTPAPA